MAITSSWLELPEPPWPSVVHGPSHQNIPMAISSPWPEPCRSAGSWSDPPSPRTALPQGPARHPSALAGPCLVRALPATPAARSCSRAARAAGGRGGALRVTLRESRPHKLACASLVRACLAHTCLTHTHVSHACASRVCPMRSCLKRFCAHVRGIGLGACRAWCASCCCWRCLAGRAHGTLRRCVLARGRCLPALPAGPARLHAHSSASHPVLHPL